MSDWQPVETVPRDGTVVLRPHRAWGALAVSWRPDVNPMFPWVNGDYAAAWPEEAFAPYWLPRPEPPQSSD